jgi:hypothetical protein
MRNIVKFAAAAVLAAGALLAVPAMAQDEARPLIIGSTRLLIIRNGDTLNGRPMSVAERIGHVQDVFAKHLGGKYAKVTWKNWGDRVHLYLNNDFTLAVTPADAAATGYKSAAQLAPVWVQALRKGFNEAHVQGKGGAT